MMANFGGVRSAARIKGMTLIDLTPAKFACYATASCPAVLKDEVSGRYVIIGERRDPDSPGICGRVGPNEVALEISAELLEGALHFLRSESRTRFGRLGWIKRVCDHFLLYWRWLRVQAASAPEANAPTSPQTKISSA